MTAGNESSYLGMVSLCNVFLRRYYYSDIHTMLHPSSPPHQTHLITMPLAMLHLRSLHESILKATRPLEYLVCRAFMDLLFALATCLMTFSEAMSIVWSYAALAPTCSIRMSVTVPIFMANGS